MTPEELAAMHPRLYHVADSNALAGIRQHGLLPTSALLDLYGVTGAERATIERQRRPASIPITHPAYGRAVITDNAPLNAQFLQASLQDGMMLPDWMMILNRRVFFWPDEAGLQTLLNARLNRGRDRLILVVKTLSLARRYAEQIELSAINSGATSRTPASTAQRGLATFTPMLRHDHATWRKLRGRRDTIREVTVTGPILDIADHVIAHCIVRGGATN